MFLSEELPIVDFEPMHIDSPELGSLRAVFGGRLLSDIPLARYTAARVGGPADLFLEVHSADELAEAVGRIWETGLPYFILGGGSNILVSDHGVRGVVVLNRARAVRFNDKSKPVTIWAESGANLGLVARQAAGRGLSGLEWAAGIPGTIGGAVFGNAGAHSADMAGNLTVAEILHRNLVSRDGALYRELWPVEKMEYGYRTSIFKRRSGEAVILAAELSLETDNPENVRARIDEFTAYRRRTQPPGASMGSMFKNPPGEYAGRLIEAAQLKGARVGDAQISIMHGNFFLNLGEASAVDIYRLIQMARKAVRNQLGVELELEIELVGDWSGVTDLREATHD